MAKLLVLIVEDGSVLVSKKKKEEQPTKQELKNCPRCGRKMSWFENDDGQIAPWCYWDQAAFLDPNMKIQQ